MTPTHDTHTITITHTFNAPRETVFNAWTDPAEVQQWWGPAHFTSPVCKIELHPGGRYLFCMRSPQGQEFWSGGVYHEIIKNERLVLTDYFSDEHGNKMDPVKFGAGPDFPKESLVRVTFEEHHGKTKLTIIYNPETAAARDAMITMQMTEGWKTSLEKLAMLVEK